MYKLITGDALDGLKELPQQSVDCIVTSPPYYALRDYGADGQIGLEATPEAYVARLVAVFSEARRVLCDDGTLWLNIADSYAGSTKGASMHPESAMKYKQGTSRGLLGAHLPRTPTSSECKAKDLVGIPWLLAFALRADGWYLRQDIIWQKPNAMPESVKDRCTKSYEHVFLLTKKPRYYFNAEAIAEPTTESTKRRVSVSTGKLPRYGGNKYTAHPDVFSRTKSGNMYAQRETRNKRDVWSISNKPFHGEHFATFPPELAQTCILAGCKERGTVLDPFVGSGTAGVVAVALGRDFVGIDINKRYVAIASERIAKEVKNEAHAK